jgi:diguanylate cyclase (GGDEF)-like protein
VHPDYSPNTPISDALPASPYSRELGEGVAQLRFDRGLETKYLSEHLRRVRLRVRIWFTFGVALSLMYTGIEMVRYGLRSDVFGFQFLLIFPCSVALAWIAWSSSYQRFYMPIARVLVPLKGALMAFFIAREIGVGRDEALASLTVYVIAAFYFSGLQFRAATVAAAAIIVTFAASALGSGGLGTAELNGLMVLLMTGAMGGIVAYDVERSYRRSFLEGAFIAELVAQDGLTGLMNRRALDEQLLRVWQQAQRDQRTLAVLMVDIDHFKAYNDAHGHQAGDAALRSVAKILRGFTRRPLDIAARYGGDEFAVILYDLPPSPVSEIAEHIRQSVHDTAARKLESSSTAPALTVSIGVGVVAPAVGRTPHGALQFADEALYQAKQAGRNCVVITDVEAYRLVKTGSFRKPA